jgi:hypothetical protein
MTLQELKYSYVLFVLAKNDYKREPTAKELGISPRGLRDTLKQMASKGLDVTSRSPNAPEYKEEDDLSVSNHVMPTNKERIAYRDWLLNADYMRSMTKRTFSL